MNEIWAPAVDSRPSRGGCHLDFHVRMVSAPGEPFDNYSIIPEYQQAKLGDTHRSYASFRGFLKLPIALRMQSCPFFEKKKGKKVGGPDFECREHLLSTAVGGPLF